VRDWKAYRGSLGCTALEVERPGGLPCTPWAARQDGRTTPQLWIRPSGEPYIPEAGRLLDQVALCGSTTLTGATAIARYDCSEQCGDTSRIGRTLINAQFLYLKRTGILSECGCRWRQRAGLQTALVRSPAHAEMAPGGCRSGTRTSRAACCETAATPSTVLACHLRSFRSECERCTPILTCTLPKHDKYLDCAHFRPQLWPLP
jgi:hypothetical protein